MSDLRPDIFYRRRIESLFADSL